MNAKQMLLDYAAKHNSGNVYTDEQFLGKAMMEGVRIANAPNGGVVVSRIKRDGKTIIVTETTTSDVLAGKMSTSVEIFRVSL